MQSSQPSSNALPPALSDALTRDVLAYLGVVHGPPSSALLCALLDGYVRKVPWESASRIAARAAVGTAPAQSPSMEAGVEPADGRIPRWSEGFWASALAHGTGGTCFESNRAMGALLRGLGFAGYLTINNMAEERACHTALMIMCEGARWLVDVGYPLHAPLRIDPLAITGADSGLLEYTVTPSAAGEFVITTLSIPNPYTFTLIDAPVRDADYCAATRADYGPGGYFLDRIILRKVIDGRIHRFDHRDIPYHVQVFEPGGRADHPLRDDAPAALARIFGVAEDVLAAAFDALGAPRA